MDLDELIAAAAPRTRTVRVCSRGDLASRHEALVADLQQVAMRESSLAGNADAERISAEIVAVQEEMEGAVLDVTVKALSRNGWIDLLAAHPPSREDARKGESADPRTFPIAAVAACAVEPDISRSQAEALAEALPPGEWQKLWLAVVALNTAETTVPKLQAATDILQANGRSSTTSDPGGSAEAISLDGSGEASPSTSTTTPAA